MKAIIKSHLYLYILHIVVWGMWSEPICQPIKEMMKVENFRERREERSKKREQSLFCK